MNARIAGALLLTLLPFGLASGERRASSTVLVVSVGDLTDGHFIAGAQVRIPTLGSVVRTKWNGEAAFANLAEGTYRVQVRAIGYAAADVDVQVKGDTLGVFCQLERLPTALDTVRVFGSAPFMNVGGMREFETRQRMGIGRFITDSILQADRLQSLPLLLANRIPGLRVNDHGTISTTEPSGIFGASMNSVDCPVLVYLDGFKLAGFSLDEILPHDLAGVEEYSRISAPVQYRPQGNYCKVILLWSRW